MAGDTFCPLWADSPSEPCTHNLPSPYPAPRNTHRWLRTAVSSQTPEPGQSPSPLPRIPCRHAQCWWLSSPPGSPSPLPRGRRHPRAPPPQPLSQRWGSLGLRVRPHWPVAPAPRVDSALGGAGPRPGGPHSQDAPGPQCGEDRGCHLPSCCGKPGTLHLTVTSFPEGPRGHSRGAGPGGPRGPHPVGVFPHQASQDKPWSARGREAPLGREGVSP